MTRPERPHLPSSELPRTKLEAGSPLTDADLIALILGGRLADLEAAWRLLGAFVSVRGLAQAGLEELRRAGGLSRSGAARLRAALTLTERMGERLLGTRFRSASDVDAAYRSRLAYARQERFLALMLDAKHCVFREHVVSEGSLTASIVHPREVFGPPMREAAAAVVLLHNHPSGDPTPSPEDREITRRLREVGSLVGIPVVDHVIVAETGFFSFAERGWPSS